MDVQETIRGFITDHFLKGDEARTISDDVSFLEADRDSRKNVKEKPGR